MKSFRSQRPKYLDLGLKLVYEDETVLVVEKPAGLLTVATDKETGRTALASLKNYLGGAFVGVVHRLDRDTSGVMMFVKTPEAREKLRSDWTNQVIGRTYYAVIEGHLPQETGTVHNWLRKNAALRVYGMSKPEPGAEEAITHWEVVSTSETRSLVKLTLETGRSNQIRVHMAELGHPVVGDKKYGKASGGKERLALHAALLTFIHPETGQTMEFPCPVPREVQKLLYRKADDEAKPEAKTFPRSPAKKPGSFGKTPGSRSSRPSSLGDKKPRAPRAPGSPLKKPRSPR